VNLIFNTYDSDSQPGCRGTQGCREEVSGVPPNIVFFVFYKGFTNFLLILKGAVNQKRLKRLAYDVEAGPNLIKLLGAYLGA
jgi:hypothetical protein